jgi:hypothetical protein
MNAQRAGIVLYAVSLAACDNLLGLHELVPDGEPVALSILSASKSVASQPLGLITVTIEDVQGKAVPDFTGEISLAFGNNPGSATLLGTLTTTATTGIAHFDLVGIDSPGTGYTLIASTAGLPSATSSPIEIVAPRFTPVATGIAGGRITGIAVSPARAGGTTTVFAGAGDGVHRSGDGGASWKLASFGGHTAGHLIADPSQAGVVYSWTFESVKKTTDGGGSWHDLPAGDARSVALDPRNPSVIYMAGSETRRSTDGGTSWTKLSAPRCERIAVDAVFADTLYCVSPDQTRQNLGVFKSRDGGVVWSATKGLGPLSFVSSMVATPRGVFVSADGVLYRSIDPDDSWTRVASGFSNALAYAPSRPDRIYLATSSRISVSNDGGASFGAPVNTGDFIEDLAVDPMNPDVVYAAGNRLGVLVSTNGGVSWSPSSKGIDAHVISSVAMAPGAPNIVLTTTPRGTLRTTDGGTSWTTVSQVNASVQFDPAASTRAYLCGFFFFATSTDGGASFTGGNPAGFDSSCDRLLVAGTTLFAVGLGRLLKSVDNGASWADTGVDENLYVFDAVLGDSTGNTVIVGTVDGIHRSRDGGASFTRMTDGFSLSIVADPRMPTRIIGGQCPGFRISSDGGASFGNVIGSVCVERLISAGPALYAIGSSSSGMVLLTSTDGGSSWTPVDASGIPTSNGGSGGGVNVTSIAVSDDGNSVYFATTAGLYKSITR